MFTSWVYNILDLGKRNTGTLVSCITYIYQYALLWYTCELLKDTLRVIRARLHANVAWYRILSLNIVQSWQDAVRQKELEIKIIYHPFLIAFVDGCIMVWCYPSVCPFWTCIHVRPFVRRALHLSVALSKIIFVGCGPHYGRFKKQSKWGHPGWRNRD